MSIQEQANNLIETWGAGTAIHKLKKAITEKESFIDRNGYTPKDLADIREWKSIIDAINAAATK